MNLHVMPDGSEQIHYQNPEIPIYIRSGDLIRLPNMAALSHWHKDVEILFVEKGHLSYNVNGNIVRIEEGDAIFITPRQMHHGFSSDGTDCRYVCICFHPELLASHRYLYEHYVEPIVTHTGMPYLLIEKGKPGNDRILNVICGITEKRDLDLELMGKLFELWQCIYDISKVNDTVSIDKNLENLKQMIAFIHTQYAERITLDQIAAAGSVCRSRCCQLFKKYIGSSPNEYVTSYRLERAMEFLRETDSSVTEIANNCGFSSSSYFAESFAKWKGCTPTEYRRLYRQRV